MSTPRSALIKALSEQFFVPLFTGPRADRAWDVTQALLDAGVTFVEFVCRVPKAGDIVADLCDKLRQKYPNARLLAGTVRDPVLAESLIQAGAAGIVSPSYNRAVLEVCAKHQVLYMPGCATPTEIDDVRLAHTELGGGESVVKFFPANCYGGPVFVRSYLGTNPGANLMATGGIEPTEDHFRRYYDAGALAVGLGSSFLPTDLVQNGDLGEITTSTRRAVALAARVRQT